jgi:hypothetical protein
MSLLTGSAHDARGVNRAAQFSPGLVMQSLVAEGPTVIEAVVDSDHSVDAVYD